MKKITKYHIIALGIFPGTAVLCFAVVVLAGFLFEINLFWFLVLSFIVSPFISAIYRISILKRHKELLPAEELKGNGNLFLNDPIFCLHIPGEIFFSVGSAIIAIGELL